MIIDCVGCLHGNYPKLPGGDLLIITGDLTARDKEKEYLDCFDWIHEQNYRKKVLIAGNHDTLMQKDNYSGPMHCEFEYLCDSYIIFEGIKIYGTPWTLNFKGQNPKCKGFGIETEEELEQKFSDILLHHDDVDILVSHSPPYGILDKIIEGDHVGSKYLRNALEYAIRPKLHVFSHIHESYGQETFKDSTICVNCSHVDERYRPVNNPVRIII